MRGARLLEVASEEAESGINQRERPGREMGRLRLVALNCAALATLLAAGCSQGGGADAGSATSHGTGSSSGGSSATTTVTTSTSSFSGTSSGTSTSSSGSSGSSNCSTGTGGSSGAASTLAGSIACDYVGQSCFDNIGYPGAGLAFCSTFGACFFSGTDCLGAICHACSAVDGEVLSEGSIAEPVFFSGLCPEPADYMPRMHGSRRVRAWRHWGTAARRGLSDPQSRRSLC